MKLISILIFFILVSCQNSQYGAFGGVRKQRSRQIQSNTRLFEDMNNEYKVVSYFLNYQQKSYYQNLDDEAKSKFLESFWQANDPNPVSERNDFLELIRERVAYCNFHFSHFSDGWSTDRGRIYIRYGAPFDISKERTSAHTKYVIKDYEIWKFRMNQYMTFIFYDQQGHGDLRLIYADGDDSEITSPDWLDLLGTDFDISDLY